MARPVEGLASVHYDPGFPSSAMEPGVLARVCQRPTKESVTDPEGRGSTIRVLASLRGSMPKDG